MSFIRSLLMMGSAGALCFSAHAFAAEGAPPADVAATPIAAQGAIVQALNINTATAEQLAKLKGVSSAKAQAIVDYRTQHGSFKSVNELTHVKGFSGKAVEKLQAKNPGALVAG